MVAPLAGAWIEIFAPAVKNLFVIVAPLAGAWIEINFSLPRRKRISGRPPRGGVD